MKDQSARRLFIFLLFIPFLLTVVLLIVLPHIDMLTLSLRHKIGPGEYDNFSFNNYLFFFENKVYVETLIKTIVVSVFCTFMTLLIGFPISYYIAKLARGRSKAFLFLLCLLPLWVSELVRSFGWMILLRESGILSSFLIWLGLIDQPIEFLYNDVIIIMGLIYNSMLFMIVPLVSTIDSLDDSYIEAGYNLGGNVFTVMKKIVIPHAMPGIVSGCIIVFMFTIGNYLTPILLGGKNSTWFTGYIYTQFVTRYNWELGATFGLLLLLVSSTMVWLTLKLTRQSLSNTIAR